MAQSVLTPVYGVIQTISPSQNQCCDSMITLLTSNGTVRFAAGPDTVVIDSARLSPGMSVAAFTIPICRYPLFFRPNIRQLSLPDGGRMKMWRPDSSTGTWLPPISPCN